MSLAMIDTPNGDLIHDRWAVLERCRQRLHWIAVRIMGCREDAEDVVQEAALRWLQVDPATVRAPEGWLVTVTTRLSIDHARRASTERRVHRAIHDPASDTSSSAWRAADEPTEIAAELSEAFRIIRARLAPAERTALVLREVFAFEYGELARLLGKTEAACRQIVRRARERVRQATSGLALCVDDAPGLERQFVRAVTAGDREAALAAINADAPSTTHRQVHRGARAFTGRGSRGVDRRRSREGRRSWEADATTATPAA
jgi:RNA polymerase sigma-70 factor (ECF subfamily)